MPLKQAMRIIIGLVGLFNVAVGLAFIVDPVRLAAGFALSPIGDQGLATIRADFPAFFLTGGLFALFGARRADPRPLVVPLMLLGIAFAGRTLSLILEGPNPMSFQPMAAEAAMIGLLLLAQRAFAK